MFANATSAPPDGPLRHQWRADDVIRTELLGLVNFPPGHRGALHSHAFWELVYLGSGRGVCLRDGVRTPCAAGAFLMIRPGERHQFVSDPEFPLEQLYFGFSFDRGEPLPAGAADRVPVGPLADLVAAEMRASLEQLKRDRGPEALALVRGRLLALAGRVTAFLTAPEDAGEGDKPVLIRMARDYLEAHLAAKLTVPDLARYFCLSPQYFGEIFKRETGLSVKEYLRNLRMERARALLLATDLPVTAVAEAVGLEDLAYFSRLFKQRFGIPPRQVRAGG